jgi:hypothetical protein
MRFISKIYYNKIESYMSYVNENPEIMPYLLTEFRRKQIVFFVEPS